MRARFQLAADLEVEIEGDFQNKEVHFRVRYGETPEPGEKDKRVFTGVPMRKGAARAISSTIMGCAAELD